jgi:hypothetical protein
LLEALSRPIWNSEKTPITTAPANTLANASHKLARTDKFSNTILLGRLGEACLDSVESSKAMALSVE